MEELENLKNGFESLKNDLSPEIEGLKEIKDNVQNLKSELDPEDQENKEAVKSGKDPEELMSPELESPMSPMRRRMLEMQEQGKFIYFSILKSLLKNV